MTTIACPGAFVICNGVVFRTLGIKIEQNWVVTVQLIWVSLGFSCGAAQSSLTAPFFLKLAVPGLVGMGERGPRWSGADLEAVEPLGGVGGGGVVVGEAPGAAV